MPPLLIILLLISIMANSPSLTWQEGNIAVLPTTLGDALPTPQTQRTIQGYDSQILPNSEIQAGRNMAADAQELQDKQNKDAILDAQNRSNTAKQKTMDLLYGDGKNEGLFAAKGGAAIGSGDKYQKAFAAIRAEALAGVNNITAQKALGSDLAALNLSNLDNVKRFEMQERRGYTGDLTQAQQDLDSQRAGLEYNNQNTINTLLVDADKTGATAAKLKGALPGDLIWKQEMTKARGAVLSAQLDSMSKSKDPNVLMQFNAKYDEYRQAGNLPLADVEKFDKIKETITPTIDALKGRADDNHQQLTYQVPEDKIVSAIGQTESGGDPTAVSPKGATGTMGIMPETALEIAGGDKAKAAAILSNPTENAKAGAQYYQQMKTQFGDTRMALMAYNAGPTVVNDWINGTNKSGKNDSNLKIGDPSKGQVSVDQFIAQVPFAETRAYPGKVLKNAGYTGTIGPTDMAMAQDRAAKMLPESGKAYLEMVKHDNDAYAAQVDQTRKTTMDSALQYMADQGAGYRLMPLDLQSQIDSAGLTAQIKAYNPTAPSDPSTLQYLMGLPPKKLAETDLNTPDIRLSLSPVDYSKWEQKKKQMGTAGGQIAESFMQNVLREGFARRGQTIHTHFDANTGEAVTEGGEDYIRAHDLLNQSVDAYAQENGGRLPDGAAIQKMSDQIFTKLVVPGKWWGTNELDKYAIKRADITGEEEQQILDTLKKNGETPTDQKVLTMYIKRHGANNG